MSSLLLWHKPRTRNIRPWWIGGLAAGALASATAYFLHRRSRRHSAAAHPDAVASHLPAAPIPDSEAWMSGGKSMDTLVPAAYAVPDPAAAMHLEETHDRSATSDAPPVTSVFTDTAPDAGTPTRPDPTAPHASIASSEAVPYPEPWMDALRLAMEKDPQELGYNRSTWTAPLLGRYLLDTQGASVPLSRLRGAIKDLGYHWEYTRYVQTRPELRR